MKRRTAHRLAWRTAVALAGLMPLAAGCGSSSSTAGSTPPPTVATTAATSAASSPAQPTSVLCQDVAALRTSLTSLTDITVSKNTKNELTAKLTDVKTSLTTLASHAHNQWSVQINKLKSALTDLQTQVTALGNGGSVTNVVAALGSVTAAGRDLLAAAGTRCPSATASP